MNLLGLRDKSHIGKRKSFKLGQLTRESIKVAAASIIALGYAGTALAQTTGEPVPVLQTPQLQPTSQSQPSVSLGLAPVPDKRFDIFREKNTRDTFPGPSESITGDIGGFRSALASYGIGFDGVDTNRFQYNALENAHPKGNAAPTYDGETLTYSGQHEWLFTYDASRIGLPGGQFVLAPIAWIVSRKADGPSRVRISRLSYYQPFFGGKVELKLGYGTLLVEAIGLLGVGGNAVAQTNGPTAIIPVEVGFGRYPLTQPYAKLTVHGPGSLANGLYNQTGVARSNSPLGSAYQADTNGIGLTFGAPRARALVYDEVGVQQMSAPGHAQLWVRGGGIYNFTSYPKFAGGNSTNNWCAYFLIDRQITQIDPANPVRGVYAGGTAIQAPPNVNAFSQYYEARLYAIGLFPSRPRDIMSVLIDTNIISDQARHKFGELHLTSASTQPGIALGYTARLTNGVFFSPVVAYSTNPSLEPNLKPALSLAATFTFLY
jgi:porin